jgi:hypothetical protein
MQCNCEMSANDRFGPLVREPPFIRPSPGTQRLVILCIGHSSPRGPIRRTSLGNIEFSGMSVSVLGVGKASTQIRVLCYPCQLQWVNGQPKPQPFYAALSTRRKTEATVTLDFPSFERPFSNSVQSLINRWKASIIKAIHPNFFFGLIVSLCIMMPSTGSINLVWLSWALVISKASALCYTFAKTKQGSLVFLRVVYNLHFYPL